MLLPTRAHPTRGGTFLERGCRRSGYVTRISSSALPLGAVLQGHSRVIAAGDHRQAPAATMRPREYVSTVWQMLNRMQPWYTPKVVPQAPQGYELIVVTVAMPWQSRPLA